MRLTAEKLELYDLPGKGKAANAISGAVTTATKDAIRSIGRRYDERLASRSICDAMSATMYPIMDKYSDLGASDTEPRWAVEHEIVSRIGKRYGLSEFDCHSLAYRL